MREIVIIANPHLLRVESIVALEIVRNQDSTRWLLVLAATFAFGPLWRRLVNLVRLGPWRSL